MARPRPDLARGMGLELGLSKRVHREKREVDIQSKDRAVHKECHNHEKPILGVFYPKEGQDRWPVHVQGAASCRRGSRSWCPRAAVLVARRLSTASLTSTPVPREAPPSGQPSQAHSSPCPVSSTGLGRTRAPRAAWLLPRFSPRDTLWEARPLGIGGSTASCRPGRLGFPPRGLGRESLSHADRPPARSGASVPSWLREAELLRPRLSPLKLP